MSASVMWKHFNDIMQMAIDKFKFVPKKKKEKKPLWMTGSVLRTVKKKHKLWKKWRKTKDANTELKYKKQVNKASKAVKLAKRNFEKQIAKKIKSDPKSFYSYVKSKTKFKSTVGPLTNDKGDLVGDYREMAELLNTFLHLCLLQKIPITYQILITSFFMWTVRDILITSELVHSKLSK